MEKGRSLFISNGSGEDTVSLALIMEIRKAKPDYILRSFPLVGKGEIFSKFNIELAGPQKNMPSCGLINNNFFALLSDFKSGLINLTLEQIKFLRANFHNYDLIVCVGDRVPVIMAGLFTSLPVIFAGIAQSVRVHGYSVLEKFLLRKRANIVFARDEETSCDLKKSGINAFFPGNPMMDTFSVESDDFQFTSSFPAVTILPGSRGEFFYNMKISLQVCERVYNLYEEAVFFMALSPNISMDLFCEITEGEGWHILCTENKYITIQKDMIKILVSQECFGPMVERAQVVFGLGGTANEQAAGLGKPVVTFWSPKRQVKFAFLKHQKKLLGNSLIIGPPEPSLLAEEIVTLLKDSKKAKEIGLVGTAMIGPRGGLKKISDYVINFIDKL